MIGAVIAVTRRTIHFGYFAQLFFFYDLAPCLRIGLMMQAVTNGQRFFILLTGIDHSLAFRFRYGHGLFAPHMFTGIGRPYHILLVHRWRQYHIHHIYIGVIGNGIEVLIVVNILVGNIILLFPGFCFGRCAGNNTRQVTMFGLLQGRRQQVGTIISQAYQGYAQFVFMQSFSREK